MAELKTKPNEKSVNEFLASLQDEQRKKDCITLKSIMEKITRQDGVMWGESIVGFGLYQYRYKTGREGEWFRIGFSPRKQNLTIYFMCGWDENQELLAALGKHKKGKGCLYVKKLEDIDLKVLKKMLTQSYKAKVT